MSVDEEEKVCAQFTELCPHTIATSDGVFLPTLTQTEMQMTLKLFTHPGGLRKVKNYLPVLSQTHLEVQLLSIELSIGYNVLPCNTIQY